MAIRKILVPVDGTENSRPPLALALALAGRLGAEVCALHARIDPLNAVSIAGEGMSGEVIQELFEITEQQGRARAAMARSLFADACQAAMIREGPPPQAGGAGAYFLERLEREEDAVVRFGRVADLTVMARPTVSHDPAAHSALHAALFESGHPVLVPGLTGGSSEFGRILIAWNGSLEAVRAVSAALPFLESAGEVAIATPPAEAEGVHPFEDLAGYLGLHGITSQTIALAEGRPAGEALLEVARGFDLMVMGAYTHSRLWHLILGGVTKQMLEHASLPLLMAH